MPAVTVCVAVYNGEVYLDKALEALCAQAFADLEIVISDNASTDATPAIIQKWAAIDKRIRVHRQPENIGARLNYIWLLENTSSPLMMFAAYDDLWTPNYVAELHELFVSHPYAEVAVADVNIMKDGAITTKLPFHEPINDTTGVTRAKLAMTNARSGWFYGLYRREALAKSWFEAERVEYGWGQDFLVLLPFILAGTLVGTNKASFYQLDTGISAARYKPQTIYQQAHLYLTYLAHCLRTLWRAPLGMGQKIALLPSMFVFTGHHGWRFRRLLLHTLRAPFWGIKRKYFPSKRDLRS